MNYEFMPSQMNDGALLYEESFRSPVKEAFFERTLSEKRKMGVEYGSDVDFEPVVTIQGWLIALIVISIIISIIAIVAAFLVTPKTGPAGPAGPPGPQGPPAKCPSVSLALPENGTTLSNNAYSNNNAYSQTISSTLPTGSQQFQPAYASSDAYQSDIQSMTQLRHAARALEVSRTMQDLGGSPTTPQNVVGYYSGMQPQHNTMMNANQKTVQSTTNSGTKNNTTTTTTSKNNLTTSKSNCKMCQ